MKWERMTATGMAAFGLVVVLFALLAVGTLLVAADAPVDNFEWLPERNVTDNANDQYPRALLKDMSTGELTLVYTRYKSTGSLYKEIDCDAVAVLNRTTLEWEDLIEMGHMNIVHYVAYANHIYLFHPWYGTGHLSISIDGLQAARAVDYEFPPGTLSDVDYTVVRMDDDEMVLFVKVVHQAPTWSNNRMTFHLVTIDMDTYESTTETLAYGIADFSNYLDVHVDGASIDVLWQYFDGSAGYLYRLEHDMDTGATTGPRLFDTLRFQNLYYPMQPVWAGDGTIHLLLPDQGPLLIRYNRDGEREGDIDLHGLVPSPTDSAYSRLPLVVNASGCPYIGHYSRMTSYIKTLVLAPDYSGYIARTVLDGDFESHTLRVMLDDDDHIVLVYTKAVGDVATIRSLIQVPATPDLEVDPSSFRFVDDHEHGNEGVAFSVRNIGKARATGYNVSVTCTSPDREELILVGAEDVDSPLPPDGSRDHSFDTSLPGGTCLVRVTISRTGPMEIWTENNVFEVWINVRNKPPVLEVYWPHDHQFVDDVIYFAGLTSDPEDPDGVMTRITLPGSGYYHEMGGSGAWDLELDCPEVVSGTYVLQFIATDGESTVIVERMVHIDHIDETLKVARYSPEGDLELIVGQAATFLFEAEYLFEQYHPLAYTWTVDDIEVAEGITSHAILATEVGEFVVRAEARWSDHYVDHVWNLTVREPIMPTVTIVEPEGDVTVTKGAMMDFTVAVHDPDGWPHSLMWTVDGIVLDTEDPLAARVTFPSSGDHLVQVTLLSTEGVSKASRTVTVENRGPAIGELVPSDPEITITDSIEMNFRIEASDPDGDVLAYVWASTGLDLRDLAGPESTLRLPCSDEVPYTVTVSVTDGEDQATFTWTVFPDPPEPPVNLAPYLVSLEPSEKTIRIDKETTITFSIVARDPEDGPLTYLWGCSRMTLDPMNSSAREITLPCTNKETYTVHVVVSDGERSFTTEWTVSAEPRDEPVDLQNGHLPVGLIAAIVVAACAAAVAYSYWTRSRGGKTDEENGEASG